MTYNLELNPSGLKKVFGLTAFVIVVLTCATLYSYEAGGDGPLINVHADTGGHNQGVARLPFMGYNSTSCISRYLRREIELGSTMCMSLFMMFLGIQIAWNAYAVGHLSPSWRVSRA